MAWIITVVDKQQSVDSLSITINFNNGTLDFNKTFTASDVSDPNWLKNQVKATLSNFKAQAIYANKYQINDDIIGVGN